VIPVTQRLPIGAWHAWIWFGGQHEFQLVVLGPPSSPIKSGNEIGVA
jgi:hypothetical protein